MTIDEALSAWGTYDLDHPFPLFAEVLKRGPIHEVRLADGVPAWLVIGHDEARSALNDPRLSKDMHAALALGGGVVSEGLPGPEFARHMLVVDPPDHTRLRRLVASAFSVRTVEELEGRIRAITDQLLDDVAALNTSAPVDLVARFAFPLPFTVICELLGVPPEDRTPLGRGFVEMLVPTPTPDAFEQAKEASDRVVAMLRALVLRKQDEPSDDLVSGLIEARDGDEHLDTRELLSTIFQLIVAGHDTTTSLIGNAVVALLAHPNELERLRSDPSLLAPAIEELLRFDAPVPHSTFRYAVEPMDLGGVTIPVGAQVIICLAGADRDPGHFTDPQRLDLGRHEGRHLAFGHGIHHCLGAPLARLEGQVAIGSLIKRFPTFRLGCDLDELHWRHGDGLVLRGLSELPIIPGPAQGA